MKKVFLAAACLLAACRVSNAAVIVQNGFSSGSLQLVGGSTITSNGTLTISTAAGTSTAGTNIFIDGSGNVGINNGAPKTSLHLAGTTTSRAILVNSPLAAQTGTAGTAVSEIAVFAEPYGSVNSSMLDILAYSTGTTQPVFRISNHWENTAAPATSSSGTIAMGFYTGSTYNDVLAISTLSAVGINRLNPAASLHVVSSSTAGGTPALRVDNNAGTGILAVTQNGRVGIGVTNPAAVFHTNTAVDENIWIRTNTGIEMLSANDSGASYNTFKLDGAPLQLNVSGGGSVSVGNGTPRSPLDVYGTGGLTVRDQETIIGTTTAQGNLQVGTNAGTYFTISQSADQVTDTFATEANPRWRLMGLSGGGSGNSGIEFCPGGATSCAVGGASVGLVNSSRALGFFTSNATSLTERARFDSSGNLGIKTANPATLFHMSSGTLTIDGNTATALIVNPTTSAPATATAVVVGSMTVTSGAFTMSIKTKAQLDVITPAVGNAYICSDCAVAYAICTATGTTLSGFRRADSSTAGCGSGN